MGTAVSVSGFTAPQLRTIKATVARDTNDIEFDLFLEACRSYGLDPFRKQIHAVVYGKHDDAKRKMSIIVSRDGLRVLAQRCKDYRPASEPAQIVYDDALKGPTNPKGIVSATIRLWKQDNRGEWFAVIGEAHWDEFAPLREIWAEDDRGKRRPSGKYELDASGNWARMPIVMITKCAESQALRAGWPDQFGNIHAEEEMDRVQAQDTASGQLHAFEREQRQERLGGPGLMFVFDDTGVLVKIPMGQVHDRCMEFLGTATPQEAHVFRIRNQESLKIFWAQDKAAALDIKSRMEALEAKLHDAKAA